MRSANLTKSGEPSVVTLVTKSIIDFLVSPSFQEGSGSWLRPLSCGRTATGIPRTLAGATKIKFFFLTRIRVGGEPWSLYSYENDVIRALHEPRVHFALNCMSVSCPRLPRVPFTGANLDAELDAAAREFFNDARNVRVDHASHTVHLSEILDFYTKDFLASAPSLLAYVNRYRAARVPEDYAVKFFAYDWTVNRQ